MDAEGKRLNKYISDAGVCSRREADRLIEAGKVEIRRKSRKDEPAHECIRGQIGDRVFHGDTVYVNGKELPKKEPEKVYFLYNKPRGVICTSDRSVEGNIADAAGLSGHVTYAGRLDKDSSGLLILTNDGGLIDGMMRASNRHEKEYQCTVDKAVTKEFIAAMSAGVKILLDDDEHLRKNPNGVYVTTRPCKVKQTGDRKFSIVLTQGYNRQIRRMCRALGYEVSSLVRVRIMSLRLGTLKEGSIRKLLPEEVQLLRKAIQKSAPDHDGLKTRDSAPKAVYHKTNSYKTDSGRKQTAFRPGGRRSESRRGPGKRK